MSVVARLVPFVVVAAALVAACSDATSPTQAMSASASLSASKGGGGVGGGGGGAIGVTQLVVTTAPTANSTGTWVGTSDGPDVPHTYTFSLKQSGAGMVSGSGTMATATLNAAYAIVGTVNGDTLMLYVGTPCGSCTLSPIYRGLVSASGSQIAGNFVNGGVSPVTLFKQ